MVIYFIKLNSDNERVSISLIFTTSYCIREIGKIYNGILSSLFSMYKENITPLHIALENNSKKIGELLISKGADINAKDIIYQIIIILFLIKII